MDHVSSDGPVDARHFGSFGGDISYLKVDRSGEALHLVPLYRYRVGNEN